MPRLAVAMPAHNRARFIGRAMGSVLRQTGVDLELIVVDDGSTDGTADVVRAFDDPRVTLLGNPRRRGIGFCHNRALAASESPYVTHLDSDDFLLPGALETMLAYVEERPDVGQAFCNFYVVDEEGRITPSEARRQRQVLRRTRPQPDIGRSLIVHGMVASGVRTYRREVFDHVGRFNEDLRYAVDYDMAVRIAEHYELGLVPAFLSCQRVHGGNTSESLRFRRVRHWWTRTRVCRRLLRRNDGHLLGRTGPEVYALLFLGLLHLTGLPAGLKRLVRPLRGT